MNERKKKGGRETFFSRIPSVPSAWKMPSGFLPPAVGASLTHGKMKKRPLAWTVSAVGLDKK